MRRLKRFATEIKSLMGGVRNTEQQERSPGNVPAEDSCEPGEFEFLLSKQDTAPPLPGVSLVAACMNREENLMKVLGSWLATDADEIVIVDWSSTSEIWSKLSAIADPRIKVIRIDNEKKWILTHALNVGLRFAAHELVFKIDCDIKLSPDFLKVNLPRPGEFVRGFWKSGLEHGGEGQQYINGTFGARKKDLREANYYDERILTYGWDDSDIYMRLTHDLGVAAKQIDPATLRHLEQTHDQRTANQVVSANRFLGKFEPTEFEGAKNKYYTFIAGNWATYFISQDYGISQVQHQFYRGRRTTKMPRHKADFDRLAEVLACKQLAVWALPEILGIGSEDEIISIEFSKLLREAHAINKSQNLIEGIKSGKGVYFVRCDSGKSRAALLRTLQVICRHYPSFANCLVVTESAAEFMTTGAPADSEGNMLIASGALLEIMASRAGAKELSGIGELEQLVILGDHEARHMSLSAHSLAIEVITKASQFSEALRDDFEILSKPVPNSCLVTSLYDEQNLIRLIEYLACVVENLRVFQRIVIYYEMSSGLLSTVLHQISQQLEIPAGRLLLLPYQKRPTFEELFSVQDLLPAGTTIAVANADVAFDASFSIIKKVDLSSNVVVLTRRDVSRDGTKANLIRLENGMPNTFSSDAWITSTPFEPDFFLDYLIGTMHCDSFINHQVSKSSRYGLINPCLDIKIFHLHDDRFNSSTEKAARDFEIMKENYSHERERNGGEDPIKGVTWSTLASAASGPGAIKFQLWTPKVLVLHFEKCSELSFGHFLILHYLLFEPVPKAGGVLVWIRLPRKNIGGVIETVLTQLQAHLSCNNFLLDFDDEDFDETQKLSDNIASRTVSFEEVAEWKAKGSMDKIYEFLAWPFIEGLEFLRCEVFGDISTQAIVNLLNALRRQKDPSLNSLLEFFNGLPDYSPQKNLLTPFIVPQVQSNPEGKGTRSEVTNRPSVSFVTSLFKGGEFLKGYLENVFIAAREAQGEVIIIDANVDDNDSRVVNDFLDKHPDARSVIDYVRLDKDPGLYECWKIGIERARADLITNANIDDRRCPSHTLRLVQILNEHPEYAGACGSISCVKSGGEGGWFAFEENEIWFYHEPINEIRFADLYRINERGEVMSRNVMHCMPVWRKSLHQRYGYFDEESYGTSADWAFWLKCTKAGERFVFDKNSFGRYYMNPESHNRRNDQDGIKERRIIKDLIGMAQGAIKKQ